MDKKVKLARIAGFLYFLIIVFGIIAQIFVRDSLVDYSNASVTSGNILSSEFLYRFGFVSELLMLVSDIGVTTILFLIFKEFNSGITIVSSLFRLTAIIVLGVISLTHYGALFFIKGSQYLNVFDPAQLDSLALLSIKLHGAGYNICLLFFGFHLLFLSWLIFKSSYFPKFLSYLLVVGGCCYIINSFTWFLFPDLVKYIYPAILIPCSLGELIFSFWLLIKGVSPKKIKNG